MPFPFTQLAGEVKKRIVDYSFLDEDKHNDEGTSRSAYALYRVSRQLRLLVAPQLFKSLNLLIDPATEAFLPPPLPPTLPTDTYVRELTIGPRRQHFETVKRYTNIETLCFMITVNDSGQEESFRPMFQAINLLSMAHNFPCRLVTALQPVGVEATAAEDFLECASRIKCWNFGLLPMQRTTELLQAVKVHIRDLRLGSNLDDRLTIFRESLLSSPSAACENFWNSLRYLPNLVSLDIGSKALSQEYDLRSQVKPAFLNLRPSFRNTLRTLTIRLEYFDKSILEFASNLSNVLTSLTIHVTKDDDEIGQRLDLPIATIPSFAKLRFLRLCSIRLDWMPTHVLDYLPASSLLRMETLVVEIFDTDDGEYKEMYEWQDNPNAADLWFDRIEKFSKKKGGGGGSLTRFDVTHPDQQGIEEETWSEVRKAWSELGIEASRSWEYKEGDREEADPLDETFYSASDEEGDSYGSEYVKERLE